MAKETGLGWTTFSVDDSAGTLRDIRNPTTSIEFATPREVQVVTGLDKSAQERLLLLADCSVTANGVFDDGADLSHSVFKTVPSTSVVRTTTIVVSGQTLTCEMLPTDYSLKRGEDGSFTWNVPLLLANGTAPTWS
jgi:hypothetical protein